MFGEVSRRKRFVIAACASASLLVLSACSSSSSSGGSTSSSPSTAVSSSAAGPSSTVAGSSVGSEAAASATAGSSGGKAPAGQVKVLVEAGEQQAAWNQLATKFGAENPGASVKVEGVPVDSYQQVLLTRLRSGEGPDLFYSNGGSGQLYSVKSLQKAGQLTDLTDQAWAGKIPAAAKPLYSVGGKVYGFPLALVPIGLAYNVDAFAATGAPTFTTYADLLAACKTAAAKGSPLMSVAGSAPQNTGILAQIIASSFVYSKIPDWNEQRAAGKVTFANTPQWLASLQSIVDMKNAQCLLPGSEGQSVDAMFASVANGQAVSLPGPAAVIGAVQGVNAKAKIAIWAFPGNAAADTRATLAFTDALAMNKDSKSAGTAEAFLDFLAVPANAKVFTDASGSISLPEAAAGDVPSDLGTAYASLITTQKTSALANLSWINGDVYNALGSGVQGLMTGQLTPQAVLASMDAAWAKGAPTS